MEMERNNQSFSKFFPSNSTYNIEVPLYVTYLNMVLIALMATILITPSVMVINVIWWTKELHTKYYFFVVNLLVADIVSIMVRSIFHYLMMILYLLDLNSDSAKVVLQLSVLPLSVLSRLMTIILPITVAIERMIGIGFPYRHRSIMTTKRVIGILAAVFGLSLILTVVLTIVVSVYLVWPLALAYYDSTAIPFFVVPCLTTAVFVIVANAFLYYEVYKSNRKAKENERLGNEEEAKKFEKLMKLLRISAERNNRIFGLFVSNGDIRMFSSQ